MVHSDICVAHCMLALFLLSSEKVWLKRKITVRDGGYDLVERKITVRKMHMPELFKFF
jgi:hypothetical protein